MSMDGIKTTTVTITDHQNVHDNPAYHFQNEKTTAKLIGYETEPNIDVEYQITEDESTKILYGALFFCIALTLINIFIL